MTMQEILIKAERYFNLDLEYLDVDYNGMPVKIRMNKDHSRNHRRNDDNFNHNLSLVSVIKGGSNQDSYFENETSSVTYIQKQVWGIMNWEDAKNAIIDFLYDIDYVN